MNLFNLLITIVHDWHILLWELYTILTIFNLHSVSEVASQCRLVYPEKMAAHAHNKEQA